MRMLVCSPRRPWSSFPDLVTKININFSRRGAVPVVILRGFSIVHSGGRSPLPYYAFKFPFPWPFITLAVRHVHVPVTTLSWFSDWPRDRTEDLVQGQVVTDRVLSSLTLVDKFYENLKNIPSRPCRGNLS